MLDRLYDDLDMALLRELCRSCGVPGEPFTAQGSLTASARRAIGTHVPGSYEWVDVLVPRLWRELLDSTGEDWGEEALWHVARVVLERVMDLEGELARLVSGSVVMRAVGSGLCAGFPSSDSMTVR